MAKLHLTLKSITPLLMNRLASDPRSKEQAVQLRNAPQIRAASFRGVFRYWLRAILGSLLNSAELSAHESQIFGSTEKGSAVRIKIDTTLQPQKDLFVLPRTITNNQGRQIDYTQYGYADGSLFDLVVSTHPLVPRFSPLLDKSVSLAILLGGFGRRARRLGGNLTVTHINGQEQQMLENSSAVETYIKQTLQDSLCTAQSLTGKAPITLNHRPKFPCFADGYYSILLADPYRKIDDAYEKLWSASGKFHHAGGAYGKPSPRRASAVHMKLIESQAGYHPLMTIFEWGSDSEWNLMSGFEAHVIGRGFGKIL